MSDVEDHLRAQLEEAMRKIGSLLKEIEELGERQKSRDEQTELRVAFETRSSLATALSKLEKSVDGVEDPGVYAETVGFNQAIKMCASLVKPS